MNMFINWIKKWVCLWIDSKNEYVYKDSKRKKDLHKWYRFKEILAVGRDSHRWKNSLKKRYSHRQKKFSQKEKIISNLFIYLFLRKDFERKKALMSKNQLTKQNKHTISNRGDIFYARENL